MNASNASDQPSGKRRKQIQELLIDEAISAAARDELATVLQGTVGDALTYCRAALRQFDRRASIFDEGTEAGQHFAECHVLLIVAHEAVCHVFLASSSFCRR